MTEPDATETVPAWRIDLPNGGRVTLTPYPAKEASMIEFQRDGMVTTVVLSDQALRALVQLAVSRAGVPVVLDGWRPVIAPPQEAE